MGPFHVILFLGVLFLFYVMVNREMLNGDQCVNGFLGCVANAKDTCSEVIYPYNYNNDSCSGQMSVSPPFMRFGSGFCTQPGTIGDGTYPMCITDFKCPDGYQTACKDIDGGVTFPNPAKNNYGAPNCKNVTDTYVCADKAGLAPPPTLKQIKRIIPIPPTPPTPQEISKAIKIPDPPSASTIAKKVVSSLPPGGPTITLDDLKKILKDTQSDIVSQIQDAKRTIRQDTTDDTKHILKSIRWRTDRINRKDDKRFDSIIDEVDSKASQVKREVDAEAARVRQDVNRKTKSIVKKLTPQEILSTCRVCNNCPKPS